MKTTSQIGKKMSIPPIIKPYISSDSHSLASIQSFVESIEDKVSLIAQKKLGYLPDRSISPLVFSRRASLEEEGGGAESAGFTCLRAIPFEVRSEICSRLSASALDWFEEKIAEEGSGEAFFYQYEGYWKQHCLKNEIDVSLNTFPSGAQKKAWKDFFIEEYFVKCLKDAEGRIDEIAVKDYLLFKSHRQDVTTLRLNQTSLDAPTLRSIVDLYPNLKELDLSASISDSDALEVLGNLKHLLRLSLVDCDLGPHWTQYLKPCTVLRHLDLSQTVFTKESIAELAKNNRITSLTLTACHQVNDDFLHVFQGFELLRKLDVSYCTAITGKTLSILSAMKVLSSLALRGCLLDHPEAIKNISTMESLQSLDISRCTRFIPSTLIYLSLLPSLTELYMNGCRHITNQHFKEISGCESLRELACAYNPHLNSNGIAHLSELTYLEKVDFSGCSSLDNLSLVALENSRNLQYLGLAFCSRISGDISRVIKKFKNLQSLDVRATNVNDDFIQDLEEISGLRYLDLSACSRITEEGLYYLSDHKSLEELILHNCEQIPLSIFRRWENSKLKKLELIANEIIEDEDLLDLLNLRCLEVLDLSICFRITQVGVSTFKQAGFFGKVLRD